MEKKPRRFVTVKEFAEEVGSKRDTVLHWIRTGQLPAVKLGRKWVIPIEAIYMMALGQTVATPKPTPVKGPSEPSEPTDIPEEVKEDKA
jgi:excisionase family DNA binding protein